MTDLRAMVRPLEWHEGDEPNEWKSGPYDVWCEFGGFQLYYWAIVLGEPHPTEDAAKQAAQEHHAYRILAALDPAALDRAVAEAVERERELAIRVAASLNAAISLLERGGKKAAPSDKMFRQMLLDYHKALDDWRAAIRKGDTP